MRSRTIRAVSVSLLTGIIALTAGELRAQNAFNPYYSKNLVHYDNFDWHIYKTDHFEIYYYPDIEQHLERVAGYAEGAYEQVSSDLKHDIAFKIPLIIFKTHSEFEQQNVAPGWCRRASRRSPIDRHRMLLPLDEPPDRLCALIVHELTHVFEFDIIPQGPDPPQHAALGQ